MAVYKFVAYNINGGYTVSGFTYKSYTEVFKMVTETILPMPIIEKVEIVCDNDVIEELTKDEKKMVEKIKISKQLNEWLEEHPTLDTNKRIYSSRFGKEIFEELLVKVYDEIDDTEEYHKVVEAFDIDGNTKVAHLWLIINRDKWEVGEDKLFYICIPEPDGLDCYLRKGENSGLRFFSKIPISDYYKWTQEEIDKHEVAKHLQHFKKVIEK